MDAKKLSPAQLKKQEEVETIKEKIKKSKSVILANYKGLTVMEDTDLRREFRKSNIEYKVYKNTLLRRAFNDLNYKEFDDALRGTTSIAFSYGDEVAAAKVIKQKGKELRDKLIAKCGLLNGAFIDAKKVEELASLPSREELIAKMLGSLNAPISGLAGVCRALLSGIVYALKSIHDKKAEAAN